VPVLSINVDEQTYAQVVAIADTLDRSKSWVGGDAIAGYLEHRAWMLAAIQKARRDIQDGTVTLVDHATAVAQIKAHAKSLA